MPGPSDETNQVISIIAVRNPVGGTTRLQGDNIIFTPLLDYNGPGGFEYLVQDNGTSATVPDPKTAVGHVAFPITEVNDPPIVGSDIISNIAEDSGERAIAISDLLANDSAGPPNENSQTLAVISVDDAVGGNVTIQGNQILFTPAANFNGAASFLYKVVDNGTTAGNAAPATAQGTVVFITDEVNDRPLVLDDQLTNRIEEDAASQIIPFTFLLANDAPGPTNESSQTLTLVSIGNEVGGAFTIEGTNVLFVPSSNFSGTARFTYFVQDDGTTAGLSDPRAASGTAIIFVDEVNDPPQAVDDHLVAIEEDSGDDTITMVALLGNDSAGPTNEAAQSFALISVSSPIGGTVDIAGTNVIFSPEADFAGEAGFDYTIEDDGTTAGLNDPKTATARVTFTIAEVNDPPVAVVDLLPSLPEDSPPRKIPFSVLLANDIPGPGSELNNQTLTIVSVSNLAGGTVEISGTNVLFTPTTNYYGSAAFTYRIQDNGAITRRGTEGTVIFSITAVNDPPVPGPDILSNITEDSPPRRISLSSLLANDSPGPPNESNQNQGIVSVGGAFGGSTTISGGDVIFTPATNFHGLAGFSYTMRDDGDTAGVADPQSSAGSVSFVVTEVNDPPVANNDSTPSIEEDSGTQSIPFGALLSNDTAGSENEQNQLLTIVAVGGATGGTVSISGTNILFAPSLNYNGPAGFTYAIADNGTTDGASDPRQDTAIVSFNISPVNDSPVADDQTLSADEGNATILTLTGNDSDPEVAQGLTFNIVVPPVHGTLSGLDAVSGRVIYTPAADYSGPDSFLFTITDDNQAGGPPLTSQQATININVSAAAEKPTITSATTQEGKQSTFGLNITPNPADTNVTHFRVSGVQNGTVFLNDGTTQVPNGSFITLSQGAAGLKFTPTPGLSSPATIFEFLVQAAFDGTGSGGSGLSEPAIASITVLPNLDLGDAPDPLYPTEIVNDGAQHVVLSTGALLYLGSTPPDVESSGQSSNASGDDSIGTDDEDGVAVTGSIRAEQSYTLTVHATGFGILNAWLDWNRDGDWNDVGEQVLNGESIGNQTNSYTLTAPAGILPGQSFARFRFSTQDPLGPTGARL